MPGGAALGAGAHARAHPRGNSRGGHRIGGRRRGRHGLGVGTRIGRFEIDDVAEEDFSFVELVAPDDDGLERQRALAQPGDHRLAARLDALGDGDFALAGEQFHRAHLAQIHAHRIVGALGRLLRFGLGRRFRRRLDQFAALGFFLFGLLAGLLLGFFGLGFLGLHDVNAHLAHHRQNVLDFLGGDLLRGHHGIELLIGDVAALFRLLDHLLDGRVRQVEERQRGVGSFRGLLLGRLVVLWWRRLLHSHFGLARDRLDAAARALIRHLRLHLRLSPTNAVPHRFIPPHAEVGRVETGKWAGTTPYPMSSLCAPVGRTSPPMVLWVGRPNAPPLPYGSHTPRKMRAGVGPTRPPTLCRENRGLGFRRPPLSSG